MYVLSGFVLAGTLLSSLFLSPRAVYLQSFALNRKPADDKQVPIFTTLTDNDLRSHSPLLYATYTRQLEKDTTVEFLPFFH